MTLSDWPCLLKGDVPPSKEMISARKVRVPISINNSFKCSHQSLVFGSKGTRNFSAVFDRAQDTLRNVFGMEIVEVPSRAERDAAEKALDEKGKPTKAPAKKPPAGPKVWMVRSTLDADIIAAANAPDAEILSKERDRLPNPSNHPLKNADEPFLQSDGSVFAWCASDQLGSMGLLGVVLSLILVNGKELTDRTCFLSRWVKSNQT